VNSTKVAVPGCNKTTVQEILNDNDVHILKVDVAPGGEIPLHYHNCAATMVIIKGEASAIGKKRKTVSKGDVVIKQSEEPHGFTDIKEPFCFISISSGKGIYQDKDWDMKYL